MEVKDLDSTAVRPEGTVGLDSEFLRPFIPSGKSDPQRSEADVFQKAIGEGTAYLLYQKIKEEGDHELHSRWLFRKLEQSYYNNLAQNIYGMEQFLTNYPEITQGFQAILLKGISLLNTVYQNPGLRHLGDIDLLIRKEDYPEVRKSLESADYVFNDELQGLGDPCNLNSIMCRKSSPGPRQPVLHIHWHLINTLLPLHLCNFQIDLDAIWNQSMALASGSDLRVMLPSHQMIYYAFHHSKHSFDKLIRLHDLDLTIRYYENSFDWREVLYEARRFNLTRTVYYPLCFAKEILATPIPDSVIEGLRPSKFTFLERRMIFCIAGGGKPVYARAIVYLALQKGWRHKLRFLYRCFFPSVQTGGIHAFWFLARRSRRGLKRLFQLMVSLWQK